MSNLTEVANCIASPPDAQIIQNTLLGRASSLELLTQSCLKSAPKVLFRHEGKVTHHIGSVGGKYIICRSSQTKAEIRHKDTGAKRVTLNIQGLNCSLDVAGRLYVGS